jgi:hypothetical protein
MSCHCIKANVEILRYQIECALRVDVLGRPGGLPFERVEEVFQNRLRSLMNVEEKTP